MGCDLHSKTYLWSKAENRYIDAFELLTAYDISESHLMGELVPERRYEIFAAFGHPMIGCVDFGQQYPEMECSGEGIPPFLDGTTLDVLLTRPGSGNFGFRWWLLPELKSAIRSYIGILKDPELFFVEKENNDCYLDYRDGAFTRERFEEFNRDAISGMEAVLENVLHTESLLNCDTGCWTRDDISRIVDPEKTAFLTWFDA